MAKMTDAEVLKAATALAKNGKDEKARSFGKGLVDFYAKNKSFTPDQVAGLQNIIKNAGFQLAKEEKEEKDDEDDDRADDEDDEDDEKDDVKESVDIDAAFSSLFEGHDLSEEFKQKATLVFEAAVDHKIKSKVASIKEEIEVAYQADLEEDVDLAVKDIVEKLDSYLDYVAEHWLEENEIAIETGIKVQMAESLFDGLKSLMTEHNIDVSEEKVDVVASLEEQVQNLEKKMNYMANENIKLMKENLEIERSVVFGKIAEGLTETQTSKLKELSESVKADDLKDYADSLNTLKESFFSTKPFDTRKKVEMLKEEIVEEKPAKIKAHDASVRRYVDAINKSFSN